MTNFEFYIYHLIRDCKPLALGALRIVLVFGVPIAAGWAVASSDSPEYGTYGVIVFFVLFLAALGIDKSVENSSMHLRKMGRK